MNTSARTKDPLLQRPLHVAARSGGEHVRSMTRAGRVVAGCFGAWRYGGSDGSIQALIAARADLLLGWSLWEPKWLAEFLSLLLMRVICGSCEQFA